MTSVPLVHEHAIDLGENGRGALLAVNVCDAAVGDTNTLIDMIVQATENLTGITDATSEAGNRCAVVASDLCQNPIFEYEQIDVCPSKASDCIVWRFHDRFALHIETRIEYHRYARSFTECLDQSVESAIVCFVNCLQAGGIVDVHR